MRRQWVSAVLGLGLLLSVGCAARVTRDFTRPVPWGDYHRVVVRSCNGAVDVTVGDGPDAQVSGRITAQGGSMGEATARLERLEVFTGPDPADAGVLCVEFRVPEDLRCTGVGASLSVVVPQPCGAEVETSNGTVRVGGLQDDSRLTTANGAIRVRDVSGNVTATTSNGSITAQRVQGRCDLTTSNGSVHGEDIAGDVIVQTSNGSIDVEATPLPDGTVQLRTSNGGISATLPVTLRGHFNARTSNGRVTVAGPDVRLKVLHAERDVMEGTLNDGAGGTVTAETSNGSITVDFR